MASDTLDLDEIERLAKEADERLRDCANFCRDHEAIAVAGYQTRIATLEADLRDIGAALCTSDGILIPDELNNLERIESLHRVLKLAFDARKKAEAERDAATREAEICKAIIKHCGGSFVVKCMLCGAPYDVRDPDWLKHDLTCPKHPMRDVERERDALARRMRVVEMGFWIKVEDGRYYIMAPHPYAVVGPFGRYADGWTEKRSRLEVVADSLIGRESVAVALDAAATALEKAGLMGEGRDGK
jgi:DnaJ-domain-containing protein 1